MFKKVDKNPEYGLVKEYYCPSCGKIESEKDVLYGHPDHRYCRRCGGMEVVSTGKTFNELCDEIFGSHSKFDADQFDEYIREKYVYHNPQFNPEKNQERIKFENEIKETSRRIIENNKKNSSNKNEVKCPWCGSTQIQMVPRKWSPLTGFLTNKVDRVCVNCKKKF